MQHIRGHWRPLLRAMGRRRYNLGQADSNTPQSSGHNVRRRDHISCWQLCGCRDSGRGIQSLFFLNNNNNNNNNNKTIEKFWKTCVFFGFWKFKFNSLPTQVSLDLKAQGTPSAAAYLMGYQNWLAGNGKPDIRSLFSFGGSSSSIICLPTLK